MTGARVAWVAAGLVVVASLAAMLLLHETHYRSRRSRLAEARFQGIDARLAALEDILTEDRAT